MNKTKSGGFVFALSPAKTLHFEDYECEMSEPYFSSEVKEIVAHAQKLSVKKLMKLMDISEKLAEINFHRYQNFFESSNTAGPAAMVFRGEVYQYLDVGDFTSEEVAVLNQKCIILSGLYGVVKPLDKIFPYRLEMGCSLKMGRKKDLYDFWSGKIAGYLNGLGPEVLVNLASNEYFGVVDREKINKKIIDIRFLQNKNGKCANVAILSKRARGLMARYIVKNNVTQVEGLETFSVDGYRLLEKGSDYLTFVRNAL